MSTYDAATAMERELWRLAEADDEAEIPLLLLTPEALARKPQAGRPIVMPWSSLAAYYSRPTVGESKDCIGGVAFGEYGDGIRRKTAFTRTRVLSFDLDSSAVPDVALAFAMNLAIVHETHSSTDAAPRCRAFLKLSEDVTEISVYEQLHAVVRSHLRAAELPPDESAKDCTRLSYSPVRRRGDGYKFAVTHGAALDVRAVLAAQPPPARVQPPPPLRPDHRDAYVAGALRRAATNIATAAPGSRHGQLCREAFALARLGLGEAELASALLPSWVLAAGESRKREGAKTIIDAVRARGAA